MKTEMEAELEVKLRSELLRRGCHWLGSVPELLRPTDKNNKSRLIESFHLFVILFFFFLERESFKNPPPLGSWFDETELRDALRFSPVPGVIHRWLTGVGTGSPILWWIIRDSWGFSEDSLRILWGFSEDSLRMLWGCYKISRSWLALLPFHRTSSRGRSRTRPL